MKTLKEHIEEDIEHLGMLGTGTSELVDAVEARVAELQSELAIYKGRDEAKQLVISQLERELASVQSCQMAWLPIETAPHGVWVVVMRGSCIHPSGFWAVPMIYSDSHWLAADGTAWEPSHWVPLPAQNTTEQSQPLPTAGEQFADDHVFHDAMIYGAGYMRVDSDGTKTRLHPSTVMVDVQPDQTGGGKS